MKISPWEDFTLVILHILQIFALVFLQIVYCAFVGMSLFYLTYRGLKTFDIYRPPNRGWQIVESDFLK
jgi:hypothetical protein